MVEIKICTVCKSGKPISEFYNSKRDGHQSHCKVCHNAVNKEYNDRTNYQAVYQRQYSQRPYVIEQRRSSKARYRERLDVKIKNLARTYTNHLIRAGKLQRESCAFCGDGVGEAHHTDYTQPLLIVWLCAKCHWALHNSFKEGKPCHYVLRMY